MHTETNTINTYTVSMCNPTLTQIQPRIEITHNYKKRNFKYAVEKKTRISGNCVTDPAGPSPPVCYLK